MHGNAFTLIRMITKQSKLGNTRLNALILRCIIYRPFFCILSYDVLIIFVDR